MKHVVCVKQVPDTTEVKVDEKTGTICREGVASVLNPFDEFALNEALRVKGEGDEVIVVTMGPPQAEEALKKCLAIGADQAILLCDRAFAGADTMATSFALVKAIQKIGQVDMIFCGQETLDGGTAQVGPEIARQMGFSQATYVEAVEQIKGKFAICRKETDDGYERIRARLPLVVACLPSPDFNPTIPSVMDIIAAKRKVMTTWTAEDIGGGAEQFGLAGSPTQVVKSYPPPKKGQGVVIQESPGDSVQRILELISDKGLIT
ncbi:MAG: electron transfer flavoprotein subunit beta/FixA family protein [Chloroflexota bacterium]|nr:electron transfer flavoprotein subunit beta/FixA family protein [Chloroflexota bacterium]